MSSRKYDFVIFGASGYTGQYVVEEVARVKQELKSLTYAIAGRTQSKLDSVLEVAAKNTNFDFTGVDSIIANVNDEESILSMTKQAKVVLNCVGPYRFHGEKVVSACIETGTDHVDISGEPQYLEGVQLRLNDRAVEKGVHVVGACGFDSVPADIGTLYLQNNFPGDVNSIEMIAGFDDESQGSAAINVTTLECALHGYQNRGELGGLRRALYKQKLPKSSFKGPPKRSLMWYSDMRKSWCLPNLGPDRSIVMRTQYLNYMSVNRRPIQFQAYFNVDSFLTAIGAMMFGVVFALMSVTNWTRNLVIQYPHVFTFGAFTREGPKREDLKNLKFCIMLIASGWDSTIVDPLEQHKEAPNVVKVLKVRGPDPGYGGTSAMLVQCALTMLQEKGKLPLTGGVYTPGSAFLRTTLIERLQKRGIKFEFVETEDEKK